MSNELIKHKMFISQLVYINKKIMDYTMDDIDVDKILSKFAISEQCTQKEIKTFLQIEIGVKHLFNKWSENFYCCKNDYYKNIISNLILLSKKTMTNDCISDSAIKTFIDLLTIYSSKQLIRFYSTQNKFWLKCALINIRTIQQYYKEDSNTSVQL